MAPSRSGDPRTKRDDRVEKQELLRLSLRSQRDGEPGGGHGPGDRAAEGRGGEGSRLRLGGTGRGSKIRRFSEQAISDLTRDYQNTREAYHTLLQKTQDAQRAENLERRQKGEQFRIVDPARVPEKPFKPDIPKVLLIGLFLAGGVGLGTAFFREQMDRSFRDAGDLEVAVGLRVLANIPKVKEEPAAKAA